MINGLVNNNSIPVIMINNLFRMVCFFTSKAIMDNNSNTTVGDIRKSRSLERIKNM